MFDVVCSVDRAKTLSGRVRYYRQVLQSVYCVEVRGMKDEVFLYSSNVARREEKNKKK
jgi:hypothetical protein